MPGLILTFALSLLILFHSPQPTLANTEILNFPGHPTSVAPLPSNWTTTTVLHAGNDEIIVRHITPAAPHAPPCADDDAPNECPHDLWLTLDLDHDGTWTHYDRFTLRVSWPASHPAVVAISLHPPPSSASDSAPVRTARHHLARIRLTEEGVRVPAASTQHATVPLVVRLEPLVFGVLPPSVIPVVATLLVLLSAAAYGVVPAVLRLVEDAAGMAGRELEMLEKRRKG
ncbi:hypothetical protein V8E53_012200 [Lactarius tabidus]